MRHVAYLFAVVGLACANESNSARSGFDAEALQRDTPAAPTRGSGQSEVGGGAEPDAAFDLAVGAAGPDVALDQAGGAAGPDVAFDVAGGVVAPDAIADGPSPPPAPRDAASDASGPDTLVVVGMDAGIDGGSALTCDPVLGTGCPEGQKCALNNMSVGGYIRCHRPGDGLLGQICTYSAAGDTCALGLSCFAISGETKPTCRHLCPWEARGTRPAICAGEARGQCSVMLMAYKLAYCN